MAQQQEALAKAESPVERLEALLAAIEKKAPEEGKEIRAHLEAIRKRDVVVLGQDEAFALRDQDGEIRAFKTTLTLSEGNGGLVKPGFGDNMPWVVSAQGYQMWAESAGAIIMNAPHVLVDGTLQQNPFVKRDPANGRVLEIYARAIAFRYSSKGIPQVSDRTTIFDTPAYRMIDLLGKAKKFPQAFRLLPKGMKPEGDGTWAEYTFDEATALWINTSHNEALQWFGQIINREKKAIDFAQTFAQRNALKHLSGLQKAPGPKWTVSVICWRPVTGSLIKWDPTRYAMAQTALEAAAGGDTKALMIDMTKGTDYVSDEKGDLDAEAALEEGEEVAPESTQSDASPAPAPETPEEDDIDLDAARTRRQGEMFGSKDETLEVFKQLAAAKKTVSGIYGEALTRLGVGEPIENPKTAAKVLQLMNQIADEA